MTASGPDRVVRIALTREVSRSIARCELTHLERTPIDLERARAQHRVYEDALRDAGCRVARLPGLPDHPDAVFVEDVAIVLERIAILTRPGAPSRRGEVESVAARLSELRPLARLCAPATLDGGDVLVTRETLFVGRSSRTGDLGIRQLREQVAPLGLDVVAIPVRGVLHLKTAVTEVGPDLLLLDPSAVDRSCFPGFHSILVDPAEPGAANALRIGNRVIYPEEHFRTRRRLEQAGVDVIAVPSSELARAEGGVTCCSLIVEAPPERCEPAPGRAGASGAGARSGRGIRKTTHDFARRLDRLHAVDASARLPDVAIRQPLE